VVGRLVCRLLNEIVLAADIYLLSYFAALSFIGVECVGYGGSGPGLFLV
jgi:hypothetical protein